MGSENLNWRLVACEIGVLQTVSIQKINK